MDTNRIAEIIAKNVRNPRTHDQHISLQVIKDLADYFHPDWLKDPDARLGQTAFIRRASGAESTPWDQGP